MADFSHLSDTDDSAVEELISQAQDLCVLEQVSAINFSGFSDSLLPTELESRFRKLKSFPVTKHKGTPPSTGSARRNSVQGKSESPSHEDAAIFSPSKRNPDDKMGSTPKSASGSVSPPLDSSEFSVEKRVSSPSKYNPSGNRGLKAKSKPKHGSVSSPSYSSNSSPESAIFSPSKHKSDKKRRSKPKSKSGSFSSPFGSCNSLRDSLSPPRKPGCFWCSPKRGSQRKSKENGGIGFGGLGLDRSNSDELLSDLGSFSKKEQERMLKKAMKEEEKITREAEKIVKWAKQASARMTVTGIEDELSD